jgi:hypothetical protein
MEALRPVLAIAILLIGLPAYAFDASRADIIGLRLGMSDDEVVAALQRQGFALNRAHGSMVSTTKDGQLIIDQVDGFGVSQIRYTFKRNSPAVAEVLEASVIDHFGQPQRLKPMTWCQTRERDGLCRPDAASLTYLPETLTLILRAGASVYQ